MGQWTLKDRIIQNTEVLDWWGHGGTRGVSNQKPKTVMASSEGREKYKLQLTVHNTFGIHTSSINNKT